MALPRTIVERLLGLPPRGVLAWRIDTWPDVEGNGPIEPKGTVIQGPSDAPSELLDRLARQEGRRFRLLDGDGLVYCQGRILLEDPANDGSELMFAPLEDYGAPGLGCVGIQYWEKNHAGKFGWQDL